MKFVTTKSATRSAILIALMTVGFTAYGGGDVPTKASNIGGIINTRHNLTMSYLPPDSILTMDTYRNNYGEICVYCHTPHGANTQIALPLWNRSIPATTYNTYNSSTITQPVSQPGPNSLSCLSCHDGTVSIDSIINMPGGGGYLKSQERAPTTPAQAVIKTNFLNTWVNASADPMFPAPSTHSSLLAPNGGCIHCHSNVTGSYGALNQPAAPSFDVFNIGSDLRNDHPVGIRYPTGAGNPGVDFRATNATWKNIAYFDTGNGNLDSNEIRLYNTGQGFEVECASCHDPHGVPSNGTGTVNNKTFMRVSNSGSGLCLTCHVK